MPGAMLSVPTGLVDIVRDFLEAHQLMRRLFERYRREELRFSELEELVGLSQSALSQHLARLRHVIDRPRELHRALELRLGPPMRLRDERTHLFALGAAASGLGRVLGGFSKRC